MDRDTLRAAQLVILSADGTLGEADEGVAALLDTAERCSVVVPTLAGSPALSVSRG